MRKILLVTLLSITTMVSFAQPWGHRYSTVQADQNITTDVGTSFKVSVEWGEGDWTSSSFGYGLSTDGSGWTWVNIDWFEDGSGSNKRCSTDVSISIPGKYYYAYRMEKSSVISYSFGSDAWAQNLTTLSATSTIVVGEVSKATGSWSSTDTWEDGSVPSGTENVAIMHDVNVINTTASCATVYVYSGSTLLVEDDGNLTTTGNITTEGSFTLESTASGTGSLICGGSVSGSGTNTVQRYMTNYTTSNDGWHFLSAPVSSFTIASSDFEPAAGDDDLYKYDETASSGSWLNYNGGTFGDTEFQVGIGYLAAYKTAATKSFTGSINTGTSAKSLSYTSGSAGEGWNLLGNPYTSAIDWDLLTKTGSVDGSVYVLQASTGNYISWNGSTGDLTDGIIPAMQGYFVHCTAASQTVTMESGDQVHSSTNFYKSTNDLADNTLKVILAIDDYGNNTYIQFNSNATTGFDNSQDAYKLPGFSQGPQLSTIDASNEYSINCLPLDVGDYSLQLNTVINTPAEYGLAFEGINNLIDIYETRLEDKKTNTTTDVTEGLIYMFTHEEGDENDRFVLHFADITSTGELSSDKPVSIYLANNEIVVLNANEDTSISTINILDLSGRVIYHVDSHNDNRISISNNLNTGVYIVQTKLTNGQIQSEKILIK